MADVAPEVAEDEFSRMCEALDLDLDDLDKEDDERFQLLRKTVLKAIVQGRITVDQDGLATVHLKYPVGDVDSLRFKIPTGETLIALGDQKAKNQTTQSWKVLGDLTEKPSTLFGKMRQSPDLKTCQALGALFLG